MNFDVTFDGSERPTPVYGIVRVLDEGATAQQFSVSYYWFHAWNETAAPFGEGNHEGDWGGIDLTVWVPFKSGVGPDVAKARIVDGIYHEHGNPNRFPVEKLELTTDGRPIVYLERGTNEAHPQPGGARRMEGIWPVEFPIVRQHRGGGWHYDSRVGLVDLLAGESQERTDVWLVWNYRGDWGEYDADVHKWLHGHDTTNPRSPIHQAKFAHRVELIDHR